MSLLDNDNIELIRLYEECINFIPTRNIITESMYLVESDEQLDNIYDMRISELETVQLSIKYPNSMFAELTYSGNVISKTPVTANSLRVVAMDDNTEITITFNIDRTINVIVSQDGQSVISFTVKADTADKPYIYDEEQNLLNILHTPDK